MSARNALAACAIALAVALAGCSQSGSSTTSSGRTAATPAHADLHALRKSWTVIKDGVALARRKVNNAYDDIAKGHDIAPQEAGLDLEFGSRWIQCAYNEVDRLPQDYPHKDELKNNIKDFWDSMVAIHDITDKRDTILGDYEEAVAKAKSFDSDWATASVTMQTYYHQHGGHVSAIPSIGSRVAELARGASNDEAECPN